MRRRRTLLTVLLLLLAVAAAGGGIGFLLKTEPPDYLTAVPARPDDLDRAAEVVTKGSDFRTNLLQSRPQWSSTFTADELNAFIRDQVADRAELYGTSLSAPRVIGRGDKLLLAARLGDGFFSTVVNMEVRAWLVGPERNTVAVELGGLRAGAMPIGSHWLMDRISDEARQLNCEVTWYRHEGRPVGLFHFFADTTRPPTLLRAVTVSGGAVTVAGRATAEAGVVGP